MEKERKILSAVVETLNEQAAMLNVLQDDLLFLRKDVDWLIEVMKSELGKEVEKGKEEKA